MRSRTTASFRRELEKLPQEIRERAARAFAQFQEDPSHPGLQFKKVHASEPVYSARITRDYRVVCVLSEQGALWFFVGSHKDYERLLSSL